VLLNQTRSMSSDSEKASFISGRVMAMTAYDWVPRAETDYWQFLLSGAGECGEMAVAGTNLMSASGLEARKVVFSGEDHTIIEVKIGGIWMVSDPGDYDSRLVTRAEMAALRIEEIGSLSYVVAPSDNSFIELTQQYVSTDTIIIRITRSGEPLVDATVVLKHTFDHSTRQLPCDGLAFHTDANGTITLHLGSLHYVSQYKGSEEYYWIYVNGLDTGRNVTSTGAGIVRQVDVDLASTN
jgi:hypothetical protein